MNVLMKATAGAGIGRYAPRSALVPALVVGLVVAIALDTTVVRHGSDLDPATETFSAAAFGRSEFPRIQTWVEQNAVAWDTLYRSIQDDRQAAIVDYGTSAGTFPIFPVTLEGEILEGDSGILTLEVSGAPEDLTVRLQSGPAVNGTELRDITGTITFQQFTNQIEYQDAGQALNNAMRETVLDTLDREQLSGGRVEVIGAFTLINPNNWLITPVRVDLQ